MQVSKKREIKRQVEEMNENWLNFYVSQLFAFLQNKRIVITWKKEAMKWCLHLTIYGTLVSLWWNSCQGLYFSSTLKWQFLLLIWQFSQPLKILWSLLWQKNFFFISCESSKKFLVLFFLSINLISSLLFKWCYKQNLQYGTFWEIDNLKYTVFLRL